MREQVLEKVGGEDGHLQPMVQPVNELVGDFKMVGKGAVNVRIRYQ